MKKLILAVSCVLASAAAGASDYSEEIFPSNPVLRPITLPDTMLSTGGIIGYAEEYDGDNEWRVLPFVRYGITDNFTVGVDGLTYRFYNKDGLQLAVNGGLRGGSYSEKDTGDDDDDQWSLTSSAGVFGKKVLNDNFALTFGTEYIYRDTDGNRDNRHENNYSLGIMYHFTPGWTFNAGYSYRDLSGYDQDEANIYRVGLTRSFGNDFEVGLFYKDSDYKETTPFGRHADSLDSIGGAIFTWRF